MKIINELKIETDLKMAETKKSGVFFRKFFNERRRKRKEK